MRTFILTLTCLLTFSFNAQEGIKTETFTVKGNCEECKERIENAADIKGVKISKWDVDKKVLTVTYDPGKVTLLKIKEAIAARGYDTDEVEGNAKAYKRLPGCCQYRDGQCNDKKK